MSFSRLASQEKVKLLQQSFLFFLGGCGIIALFIFGLLPIFTRMLMKNAQVSKLPSATPTVVSPPVLYQPMYTATNSAQVTIRGKADPNMGILLGINGSIDQRTASTGSGDFVFENVTLNKGGNTIVSYAEDANSNRSDGSGSISIDYLTDVPKLDVGQPTDGLLVTQRKQSVVSVKGQTDPGNKAYLNDQFLFVSSDGSFSGSFQLQQGDNLLHIRAVNTAGNETVKDVHVKYIP